jgi:hypothetical protein
VGPEVKGIVACGETGCATEIVDGESCNPSFGKAQRQLFVELVQPAYIGVDEDLRRSWVGWVSFIGSKTAAVRIRS